MNFFLNYGLDCFDDRGHEFDESELLGIFFEYFFKGDAVCVAHVRVDIDFADADFGCFFKEMRGGAAASVQADIAIDCIPDLF